MKKFKSVRAGGGSGVGTLCVCGATITISIHGRAYTTATRTAAQSFSKGLALLGFKGSVEVVDINDAF